MRTSSPQPLRKMGSHNVYHEFDGKLTPAQLKEAYDALVSSLRYEYGSDPYNGTFTTCDGLVITDRTFKTTAEADEWLLDNTQKWGVAKAAKAEDIREERSGVPKVNGEVMYQFDGPALWTRDYKTNAIVLCDQVRGRREADKLTKLIEQKRATYDAFAKATKALELAAVDVTACKPITGEWVKQTKAAQKAYTKAKDAAAKAETAYKEYHDPLYEKLFPMVTKNYGSKWVVAGWAAS